MVPQKAALYKITQNTLIHSHVPSKGEQKRKQVITYTHTYKQKWEKRLNEN